MVSFSQRAALSQVQSELATVLAERAGLAENVPRKVALYFIGEVEGKSLLVPEVRTIGPTAEPEKAALRELDQRSGDGWFKAGFATQDHHP